MCYAAFYLAGLSWLVPPLAVIYVVGVLGLDKQHLKPVPTERLVKTKISMNVLERCSSSFWSKHFDYFPITGESSERRVAEMCTSEALRRRDRCCVGCAVGSGESLTPSRPTSGV